MSENRIETAASEATAAESTTAESAATESAGSGPSTDALRHAMVEQLMAIIGAPDDEEVARAAAGVVRDLDARLRETAPAAD